jgi:hypothetical protein
MTFLPMPGSADAPGLAEGDGLAVGAAVDVGTGVGVGDGVGIGATRSTRGAHRLTEPARIVTMRLDARDAAVASTAVSVRRFEKRPPAEDGPDANGATTAPRRAQEPRRTAPVTTDPAGSPLSATDAEPAVADVRASTTAPFAPAVPTRATHVRTDAARVPETPRDVASARTTTAAMATADERDVVRRTAPEPEPEPEPRLEPEPRPERGPP